MSKRDGLTLPGGFEPLRQQLLEAAEAFGGSAGGLAALLEGLVADVARASTEALTIFPVCHHSPAAALQLVQRLRERPPRVLFLEMCEDLRRASVRNPTQAARRLPTTEAHQVV